MLMVHSQGRSQVTFRQQANGPRTPPSRLRRFWFCLLRAFAAWPS
jgi:hypothetical protein